MGLSETFWKSKQHFGKMKRGGVALGGLALTAVLSAAMVVPSVMPATYAAAAETQDATSTKKFTHGTVTITSAAAKNNVITLKEGEKATVTVAPYAHFQWKGCGDETCPEKCEESMEGTCFFPGMGCICGGKTPYERNAEVSSKSANEDVVVASAVQEDSAWQNADNMDLQDDSKPVTKNGTITLTAKKAGTTTVTVTAATDADGSKIKATKAASRELAFWDPAQVTYTVNVVSDEATQPVSQVSHSVTSYREDKYGQPPAGDTSAAGQHVKAVLTFAGAVNITDQEALLKSLSFKHDGKTANVTVSAEGNTLVLDYAIPVDLGALKAGGIQITPTAADGVLAGVTAGGKSVKLEPVSTLADTGLAFEAVSVKVGTATEPASTTFKVTHSANVRSMNHIVWLSSKGSADGTGSSILPYDASAKAAQSSVAHHHKFFSFTAKDSAGMIVDGAGASLAKLGYTVTDGGDGTFTIMAKQAVAGEVLSADNYTDSFFNKTGLAYGQAVAGVAMPKADNSDNSNGDNGSDNNGSGDQGNQGDNNNQGGNDNQGDQNNGSGNQTNGNQNGNNNGNANKPAAKPTAKPNKPAALPQTGDASLMPVAAAAAMGALCIGAALALRKRSGSRA